MKIPFCKLFTEKQGWKLMAKIEQCAIVKHSLRARACSLKFIFARDIPSPRFRLANETRSVTRFVTYTLHLIDRRCQASTYVCCTHLNANKCSQFLTIFNVFLNSFIVSTLRNSTQIIQNHNRFVLCTISISIVTVYYFDNSNYCKTWLPGLNNSIELYDARHCDKAKYSD